MGDTDGEDLDRVYQVNVRGVFNVIKAFFPSMLHNRHGVIVNIASIGGLVGVRDRLAVRLANTPSLVLLAQWLWTTPRTAFVSTRSARDA